MSDQIPEYQKGQHLRLDDANRLIRAANSLANIRGDSIIRVQKNPGGISLALDVDALLPRIPKPWGFWAKITNYSGISGHPWQWNYTFVEVEKTTAGYGGWTTLNDGRTGTARNSIEDINNTSSGVMGNGVEVLNGVSGLNACTVGNIVWINPIVCTASDPPTVEYWFSYENSDYVCW
jgi:hypothetical protein